MSCRARGRARLPLQTGIRGRLRPHFETRGRPRPREKTQTGVQEYCRAQRRARLPLQTGIRGSPRPQKNFFKKTLDKPF
jgi:hypothetical protein